MRVEMLSTAVCCALMLVGLSSADPSVVPIELNQFLCGSAWTVNQTDVIRVEVQPSPTNLIGPDCRLTFTAHEGSLQFSFFDAMVNFIEPADVSLKIYAGDSVLYPMKEFRWDSKFIPTRPEDLFVKEITVVVDGNLKSQYQLIFDISENSMDGFTLFCGVMALSIGGTTAIVIFCVLCYCCCCHPRPSNQHRSRQRMIDQLRKSGYIVTRGYGSTDDTSPLLEDETHHHPYQQHYGATTSTWPNMVGTTPKPINREPPPSYDDISSRRNMRFSSFGYDRLRNEALAVERNQQAENQEAQSGTGDVAGNETRSVVTAEVTAPPAFGSAA